MKWYFLDTGFNTGKFNMNFDLQLANQSDNEVFLRLYRWEPYCISLGANQSFGSVDLNKARQDGLDVVKRPTGGRAILHSEELTYSIVHPITSDTSAKSLYKGINLALKKGLENYNPALQELMLENYQPHFPSFYKEAKSSLCFAVSAQSEINFEGRKLVGSAQRKIGNVLLQHGSILCGSFHKKLVEYLMLTEEERTEIKNEIDFTTTELESVLNANTDFKKLIHSLRLGFEEHFDITFEIREQRELVMV